jgi:hypothetical protein
MGNGARAVLAATDGGRFRDQVAELGEAGDVGAVDQVATGLTGTDQVAASSGPAGPFSSNQVAEVTRQLDQVANGPRETDQVTIVEPTVPLLATDQVDELTGAWPRIVGNIKSSQPALGAVLDHGVPLEVTPTALRIGFPEGSFFGRQAQNSSAREAILRAAEQVLGARPTLTIGAPGDAKISTLAQTEDAARRTRSAAKREAALSHPRVLDAMEVFEESEGSVDVQVDLE